MKSLTLFFLSLLNGLEAIHFTNTKYVTSLKPGIDKAIKVTIVNEGPEPTHVALTFNQTLPGDNDPRTTEPFLRRLLAASEPKLLTPNDPGFGSQWEAQFLRYPEAWALIPNVPSNYTPLVTLISRGAQFEHKDLEGQFWTNEAEINGLPGVDDDGNGYIDDKLGWHGFGWYSSPWLGTAVEPSLIAANFNNSLGIAGIASRNVRVAICGLGSTTVTDAHVAECVKWGTDIGSQVIISTWLDVGNAADPALTRAQVERSKALFVSNAGSKGRSANDALYRDACLNTPNQISVVPIMNENGGLTSASGGTYAGGDRCVELGAPGGKITYGDSKGALTTWREGGEFAASIVGGIAAWILNAHPYLTGIELKRLIRESITKVSRLARPVTLYEGVPNIVEAIKLTRPTAIAPADGNQSWDDLRIQTRCLQPGESTTYELRATVHDTELEHKQFVGDFVAYEVDVANNYKVKHTITAPVSFMPYVPVCGSH